MIDYKTARARVDRGDMEAAEMWLEKVGNWPSSDPDIARLTSDAENLLGYSSTPSRYQNPIQARGHGLDLILAYGSHKGPPPRPRGGDMWRYRDHVVDIYPDKNGEWHWKINQPLEIGAPVELDMDPEREYELVSVQGNEATVLDVDQGVERDVMLYDLRGAPLELEDTYPDQNAAVFDATFVVDYLLHLDELRSMGREDLAERVQAISVLSRTAMNDIKARGSSDFLYRPMVAREIETMRGSQASVGQFGTLGEAHELMSDGIIPVTKVVAYLDEFIERRAVKEGKTRTPNPGRRGNGRRKGGRKKGAKGRTANPRQNSLKRLKNSLLKH